MRHLWFFGNDTNKQIQRKQNKCNCEIMTLLSQHFQYLLVHIIRQSKLFVIQTLPAIAELQNYWGSGGSRYVKRISGAQRWILNNEILFVWGCLDLPGVTSLVVVFKAKTLADLSAKMVMDYIWWCWFQHGLELCVHDSISGGSL